MALSHFRNATAAVNKFEVVNPSLFEVTITLPDDVVKSGLGAHGAGSVSNLLLQHVRTVEGLDGLNPQVGTVTQKFKFAERIYAGGPESTHLDLTVNFSLNLGDNNENYIYTTLRKWCNLIYNPMTGSMNTKKVYTDKASMVIVQYNRVGSVWRRITCEDIFPGQITGMGSNSYDDVNTAQELSMPFVCDLWKEEVIGLPDYTSTNNGTNS